MVPSPEKDLVFTFTLDGEASRAAVKWMKAHAKACRDKYTKEAASFEFSFLPVVPGDHVTVVHKTVHCKRCKQKKELP